jgi:hypothetical protein
MSVVALAIAVLVGFNAVAWGQILTRRNGRPGVFDGNPMLGVAVMVGCIVVAAWVDIR